MVPSMEIKSDITIIVNLFDFFNCQQTSNKIIFNFAVNTVYADGLCARPSAGTVMKK